MIRRIDDHVSVAPQITPEEVAAIAQAGFVEIVNNRPDDEEGGQPSGAEIAAAAAAAGIAYRAIPITHAGFSGAQVEAMASALTAAAGPVLAYCRSGTRSAHLWALARARMGDAPQELTGKAAAAGYDISGIRAMLDALAAGGR
ncbi:TIGR01244 family sulfur transferase [Sphingomonas sp.]|uniref:TIGR01244 family sulfur transferase n=1 Tax=Sphingomonas sp. TaxID=28214 RepID=UPI002DD66408|nr:TIGR01244 family sulfur transferase [Sphingomonas sp.]